MEKKKVMSANLKLTENKYEYFVLSIEGETVAAALWPDEMSQLLQQDENICMNMLGLEKFCLVLKSSIVEYEKKEEGEGDNKKELIVIKSITINDTLGIVKHAVDAFMQQMLG